MRDNILRLILLVFLGCTTAFAQPASTSATEGSRPTPFTSAVVMETDSSDTRQRLREVLRRHPPEVGRVLKLDPTLWNNEAYLAHYPALAAFASAHPEVTHSPAFYLENVLIETDPPPDTASIRLWRDTMEVISVFSMVLIIVFALTWLIRKLVEQRRWSRLSTIQFEVHNKLLDRFGSNEDLLAYIQTPTGRRFLESAPIPLGERQSPVTAPIDRILWSVQAGVVVTALGLGLLFVGSRAAKDIAEMTSALGTLAIAVGVGFVVSAGASIFMSRRLGLWQSPTTREDVP